jgi:dolichyl-phosphate beta-glucosyltransferase
MGVPWELIIADDASGSDTVKMIATLGLVNLRLLVSPKTYGKGRSVQRGILSARGRYILLTEADNSTPIEELKKLMVKVERDGYPIAIGSRAVTSGRVSRSLPDRLLTSQALRWLLRRAYHIDVQDIRCGFKLFSRRAAHQLFSAQTLTSLAFDLEILFLAQKFGFPITEVPVNWVDPPGSKLNVFREASYLLHDLARIKINDWRGVYGAQTMTQPGPA